MLDRDLAALYEVETRVLNQAVGRKRERFPLNFMFELAREEITGISQFVTSSNLKFSKRGQHKAGFEMEVTTCDLQEGALSHEENTCTCRACSKRDSIHSC